MQKAKLLLVGEAHGAQEAKINRGFVGPSGIELLRMLNEAGAITFTHEDREYLNRYYRNDELAMADCIWQLHPEVQRTNVFNFHPPGNHLEAFCGTKSEGITGWPALLQSKYLLPEYAGALDELEENIRACNPNLIVALGNTPLWALCGTSKISKLRGTTRLASHVGAGRKVLPVYHPAAVLRDWSLRPVTVIDLEKATREREFPDVRRPTREIWIEPTLADIEEFFAVHVRGCRLLSVDIETSGTRVTCIGFATSRQLALVIPLDDDRSKNKSYWPDATTERKVVNAFRKVLEDQSIPKLFQNGLYDIAFLWRSLGIRTRGAAEDTMLEHHSLQPESPKGLAFLGSVYTDEGAWKNDRRREAKTLKKDS